MRKTFNITIMILPILLICAAFTGCNNSNNNDYTSDKYIQNTDNIDNNTEAVETAPNEYAITADVDSDGYIVKNADGIIELYSYSETSHCLNPCYPKQWNEDGFILVWKNANEIIPKIDKNSTVAIYDSYEEITVIPINTSTPYYTVPLNFFGYDEEKVADFPNSLLGRGVIITSKDENIDFSVDNLLTPGNPLTECNGEDLETFINNNSVVFYHQVDAMLWHSYKILDTEKNKEFEFGGYVGTNWETFTSRACVEYYKVYPKSENQSISRTLTTEKTKNGYFTVDISTLDSGIYYVSTYNTFIEIV